MATGRRLSAYSLMQRLREEAVETFEDEVPFDELPPADRHRPTRPLGDDPPGFSVTVVEDEEEAARIVAASRKKRSSSRKRESGRKSRSRKDKERIRVETVEDEPEPTASCSGTSSSTHAGRYIYAPAPESSGYARKDSGSYRYATREKGGIPTAKNTSHVRASQVDRNRQRSSPERKSSKRTSEAAGKRTTVPEVHWRSSSGRKSRGNLSTVEMSESSFDQNSMTMSEEGSCGEQMYGAWSPRPRIRPSSYGEGKINFLEDGPKDMTYARRLALWLMQRFSWYYPRLNSKRDYEPEEILDDGRFRTEDGYPKIHKVKETPSLEKAWSYMEHVTLTRYFVVEKEDTGEEKTLWTRLKHRMTKGDKKLDRAEPGEASRPTKLYHPVFTPYKQLGDFGLGIGLYFATIRALTVVVLIAGALHFPNILYFSGNEYSNGQKEVNPLRRGSAICTDTEWVACPTCTSADFPAENEGYSWLHDNKNGIFLANRNKCEGTTLMTGFVNFAGFMFISVASFLLHIYLKGMDRFFDEDEQTAQDYSILIGNPPEDARDPKEWKDFFENAFEGCHVTGCTIALDNDRLVQTLVERREKMRKLESWVEPGTRLDMVTLAGIAINEEKKRSIFGRMIGYLFVAGFPETFGRLAVLTANVQGLAQQQYRVTNVFVTFETEITQQRILRAMTVSKYQVAKNKASAVDSPKYLFRGHRLLTVSEPEEPDSIIWEHLNASWKDLFKQQVYTAFATLVALFVVVVVVRVVNDWNTIFTAYSIALTNLLFPFSAKALTRFEAHPTHGSLQTSMYFKIALFRWVNTAIVITLITPFVDTIRNGPEGLITQIQAQFMAEITTVALIQISDPLGHFRRHILAPRAKTQDQMNVYMQGTQIELSERYTSVSKILFLTFWYSSIYPASFFICAFALQVIFIMDRFSLTRTWKRVPRLGSRISRFNRAYFLPLSIVAMAVFSSYFWSGFPYDNLCENEGSQVSDIYVGNYSIGVHQPSQSGFSLFSWYSATAENTTTVDTAVVFDVSVRIKEGEPTYRFCNQDFLRPRTGIGAYPFVPILQPDGEEWMTPDQEIVTTYFGWLSLFFMMGWVIIIIFRGLHNMVFGYFTANYKPNGEDQGYNFSDLDAIQLYIPQVRSYVVAYPLLAVSVDDIDKGVMEWYDPERPHAYYDLTKDAEALLKDRGTCVQDRVFSQVAHWPPSGALHSENTEDSVVAEKHALRDDRERISTSAPGEKDTSLHDSGTG